MKESNKLYSVTLEFVAMQHTMAPVTIGRQVHALFLNLVKQCDPALSTRLHNEPGYRPFTVSPLYRDASTGKRLEQRREQCYYLRVTFLDGGTLWECLQRHFLEASPIYASLNSTALRLNRMLTTSAADPLGWADSTDWSTLVVSPPLQHSFTIHFNSPTAFSLGEHQFDLLPEPRFVWGSLLRSWNRYAPACFTIDRQRLQSFLTRHITVTACALRTQTLFFSSYRQKGFVGRCTYLVEEDQPSATDLASLTAFAPYAGIGYQTTMGMGQVTVRFASSPVEEDLPVLPDNNATVLPRSASKSSVIEDQKRHAL